MTKIKLPLRIQMTEMSEVAPKAEEKKTILKKKKKEREQTAQQKKKKKKKKSKQQPSDSSPDDFGSSSEEEGDSSPDSDERVGVDMRPPAQTFRPWIFILGAIIVAILLLTTITFLQTSEPSFPDEDELFNSPAPTQTLRHRPTPGMENSPSPPPPTPPPSLSDFPPSLPASSSSSASSSASSSESSPSSSAPLPPSKGPSRPTPVSRARPPSSTPPAPSASSPSLSVTTVSQLPGLKNISSSIDSLRKKMASLCNRFPTSSEQTNKCLVSTLFRYFGPDNGAELKAKLLQSLLRTRTFKFVVSGASSSVGADVRTPYTLMSWLKQEFEEVFVSLLGVQSSVSNIAGQGTNSFPVSFCFNTYLPENADIITYDWATFGETNVQMETYIRALFLHPAQPILFTNQFFQGPNNMANYWSVFYYSPANNYTKIVKDNVAGFPTKSCTLPEKTLNMSEWISTCMRDEVLNKNPTTKAMYEKLTAALATPELRKLRQNSTRRGVLPKTSPFLVNPLPGSGVAQNCAGDFWCEMSNTYPGVYHTDETDAGWYFDYLPFYIQRAGLLRAAHHPGPMAHLFQASSYVYLICQLLIYALQDIDAALKARNANLLSSLATPQRRVLPGALYGSPFPFNHTGAWCSVAFRPIFGPNISLHNMSVINQTENAEAPFKWEYTVRQTGRGADPDLDNKNFWEATEAWQEGDLPLRFRFEIPSLPASIILCGPWFEHSNTLFEVGTFAIDDGAFENFSRKKFSEIAEGRLTEYWTEPDVGNYTRGCWVLGDVPRDLPLTVGEHFLSIRPGDPSGSLPNRIGSILVF